MLEQQTFTDANGVRWLNRPGPARGIPGLALPLLALIPTSIISVLTQASTRWWLIIGACYTAAFFIAAGVLMVILKTKQTCPQCHTTRLKGYSICSGCGYPHSW